MRQVMIICDRCAFTSGNSKDFQALEGDERHLCDKCWDEFMDRKRAEDIAVAEVWKGFWRVVEVVDDKPKKRKG